MSITDSFFKEISREEAESMQKTEDDNDRRSDYMFCVPHKGLFYDRSSENCLCHPGTQTFGRLLYFAKKNNKECNISPEYFQYSADGLGFKSILFVASRQIEPLEELRFDYGDDNCLSMFGTAD